MRKALLITVVVTGLCAGADAATGVKLGYGNIAGEFRYNHTNNLVAPAFTSGKTEDISAGVVTFGGEVSTPVNNLLSIGFEVGGSMTGEWTFDFTNDNTPPPGSLNPNMGDDVKYAISKFPALAKVMASFAMGPGMASVGVGLGAVIIGWSAEMTQQWWTDGATSSPDRSLTFATQSFKVVTSSAGSVPVFIFQLAPSYHYKLNKQSTVGLELPLQFATETVVDGTRTDYSIPQAFTPNPSYGSPEVMVGGMLWGVNVVYTLKL